MPSTIYNEGRVVGFSAYEIYVRHALCEDPTTTPASELEWLSSSIATGSSMLLKIPAETAQEVSGHHIINIPLPADSNLAAANTIIGSLFIGEAEVDADGWATKVTSYGPLIENNATNPTAGDHSADTTIPPTTYTSPLSDEYQDMLLNYVKVVDGIVVQPGHWSANEQPDQPPHKDFSPDLSKRPFVKIYVSDTITENFYLLLTGFTLRTVLAGVSGLNGSTDTDTNFHNNGGFLGPAVFPWANKIVFSVPPAYVNYFIDKRYERAIQNKQSSTSPESFQDSKVVKAVPVIDMESTDPATYYADAADEALRSYQMLSDRPGDWSTNYTKYFHRVGSAYQAVTGSTAPDASGDWPQDKYFKSITPSIKLDVTDANTATGDRVLTIYQRSDLLPPALYATKVTQKGGTKLYPVDTVAPGTVKLFENDSEGEAAKNLEDEIPGNRAFIRSTNDYVVRQLNESQNVVPVAEVSTLELQDPLRFEDVTPPFFVVDGSKRPDSTAVITGTTEDLDYAKVTVITLKRITGKLSSKVEELCGYGPEAFAPGGTWANANTVLFDQIDGEAKANYYYIVNATPADDHPYICPVRKSDHVIDITIPYETQICANGNLWYPEVTNSAWGTSPKRPNSLVLGSTTAGINLNSDETLAGVPVPPSTDPVPAYNEGFGYIIGAEHPTRKTRLAEVSGQIDNPTAILPASDLQDDNTPFEAYYAYDWMENWFDTDYLESKGINPHYNDYTIDNFLREALYTDVGTRQPLPKDNPNISQTLSFCSKDSTPGDVTVVLEFPLSNNEENSGKPQYLPLPKNLSDKSTFALGVHTHTGNKQAISLSVADENLNLYNFQGNGGNNIIPGDGNLHWNDLLDALANNKSIEMLRALFPGFGIAIRRTTKTVGSQQVLGWEIINDRPYIGNGLGYTPLIQDAHFKSVSYNGFTDYIGDRTTTSLQVSILPSTVTQEYRYKDASTGETVVSQIPHYINITINVGAGSSVKLGKRPFDPADLTIYKRGFYVGDSATYTQDTQPTAPNNWSTIYTTYFIKTGSHYNRISTSSAPGWTSNDPGYIGPYYTWNSADDHEYVELTQRPASWNTGYTSYFTRSATPPYTYTAVPESQYPPTWEPGKYYKYSIKWNYKPGFRFYHSNSVLSDKGVYGWIFGLRFLSSPQSATYVQLTTQPDNWDTTYMLYYTFNGTTYSRISTSVAPSWDSTSSSYIGPYYTQAGVINLVDGTTLELSPIVAAIEDGTYKFRSTSFGSSGIWNVGENESDKSPRASWGALTNMYKGFVNEDIYEVLDTEPVDWTANYSDYYVKLDPDYEEYAAVSGDEAPAFTSDTYYRKCPASFYYHPEQLPSAGSTDRDAHMFAATAGYEDGYNTQFNAYDDIVASHFPGEAQSSTEGGRKLYSDHINMEVSCILYLE